MYKRLCAYRDSVEALLAGGADANELEEALKRHLVYVQYFQHERLVHLLVTLAFALMELLCALFTLEHPEPLAAALMLLLLVALVPYVVHYYHLENGTQQLEDQYRRLLVARKEQGGNEAFRPNTPATLS